MKNTIELNTRKTTKKTLKKIEYYDQYWIYIFIFSIIFIIIQYLISIYWKWFLFPYGIDNSIWKILFMNISIFIIWIFIISKITKYEDEEEISFNKFQLLVSIILSFFILFWSYIFHVWKLVQTMNNIWMNFWYINQEIEKDNKKICFYFNFKEYIINYNEKLIKNYNYIYFDNDNKKHIWYKKEQILCWINDKSIDYYNTIQKKVFNIISNNKNIIDSCWILDLSCDLKENINKLDKIKNN